MPLKSAIRSSSWAASRISNASAQSTRCKQAALVALADGRVVRRWEAPADFGVTDLAAAHDFSSFAVGIRSLAGLEGVVWLNAQFDVIAKEERRVGQPSGSSPTVAVLATPPRATAMGQGWRATLER